MKKWIYNSVLGRKIYMFVWQKWLWNEWTQSYDIIMEVLGWRTARICNKWHMDVSIRTHCFDLFKIKFN